MGAALGRPLSRQADDIDKGWMTLRYIVCTDGGGGDRRRETEAVLSDLWQEESGCLDFVVAVGGPVGRGDHLVWDEKAGEDGRGLWLALS